MRKFIYKNKVAIIAVSLVMCVSFGFVAVAQTESGTILDRIVMAYLELKLGEQNVESDSFGMSSMLAEDNIPYIRNNDGYYSGKDITTTGTITGADMAITDDLTVVDDLTVSGETTLSGETTILEASEAVAADNT